MDPDELLDKHRKAGKILAEIKEEVKGRVKVGVPLLDIAEFVEGEIMKRGAKPAFPCNISINDEAAHATPKRGDERVFKEGDVVKIDIGAHIDGYIADTAFTVDLGDHPDLLEASREAVRRVVEILHAGISTSEIGAVVEETIRSFGFRPIVNLTGHGLARYIQHAPPSIPNIHHQHGAKLKEWDVIAIEPFATDGAGRVSERGNAEIYRLVDLKPVRSRHARELLDRIKVYKTLPFAKRWIDMKRLDLAMKELERVKAVHGYPVLKDDGGGQISQFEETVIILEDGCEVITG
ncbi:MAG TPA: type II methionyl aminopeptidase [Candidatus Syntrophoarchaeum butanivorans]|uniref:Methionine aminopeptidase n=1 Tax=Candidatus Syntropharchaeum butanivorans TaxID=1839936 RepID=A0A7J2RZY3_9EURY|nr:type II methionyl aminopeptidase [Candidatus Syntrophoarchaeum butanivorans]